MFQAHSLQASEASLTGESAPVNKQTATLPRATSLGDRSNMVFAGTAINRGTGRAVVTATGMRTGLGAVAELLSRTEEEPTLSSAKSAGSDALSESSSSASRSSW